MLEISSYLNTRALFVTAGISGALAIEISLQSPKERLTKLGKLPYLEAPCIGRCSGDTGTSRRPLFAVGDVPERPGYAICSGPLTGPPGPMMGILGGAEQVSAGCG